ncbi:MAG TPA: hypothetical protein DHN33_10390 [Eubacteriaceae bacterium]|nr:hypothetical protein [Eubacteriaceae bacterium]
MLTVFVIYTIVGFEIEVALTLGIVVNLVLMQQYIPRERGEQKVTGIEAIKNTLNAGADVFPNAFMLIVMPAALAAVITETQTFGAIVGGLAGLPVNPMLLTFIAVAIIVLLTSSPPAALMVSLPMVASIIAAQGIDVNMHLVMSVAVLTSITFESLPWNGVILFMQRLAHTNHKQSYIPYFWQTVIWTTLAALVAVGLSTLFPGMM